MLPQALAPGASADRVRHATAAHVNEGIDRQTEANIQRYSGSDREAILRRMEGLDREWDIERA